MLLIAGLGNPGPQYEGNRHNVGFTVVDEIARVSGFPPWKRLSRLEAEVSEGKLQDAKGASVPVLLLKPQTYMNESGRSVAAAMRSKYIPPENVIIFHDEIDMALGRFRMSTGRTAAGHNGIRSIYSLASPVVRRARIGVGHPGTKDQVKGSVLSGFKPSEKPVVAALIKACIDALPFLVAGNDERYQTEVMRLAPAPKANPRQTSNDPPNDKEPT